ncbi:PWWP domain-containing protein 2A isoform X1 [Rana temporaria]|uniref:PWWP domain-containing protein 2A isoform X1 n=1 Tax=Rana temporaria TaxID=8407 RepID=UPI001AACDF5F|nr:PWWP domain-containing protein 2A isoform X1 [Rana temporaria]
MAISQDEEAEDRYANEKMAAAAGAAGSGEGGGEAEPDSDPIPGEERSSELGGVPEQLGPENEPCPLEGSETGHGGEGLRQPGEEACAGPDRAEGASPWPPDMGGLAAVEPSEMDTGDCRMGESALLSTQEQEEPMQLGMDWPSAPCHGAPPSVDPVLLEAGEEMTSAEVVHPSNIEEHISTPLLVPSELEEVKATLSPLQPMMEKPIDEGCPSAPGFSGQPTNDPSFPELHMETDGETVLLEVRNPSEQRSPSPLPSQPTPVLEELRSALSPTPVLEEPRSASSPTPGSLLSHTLNLEDPRPTSSPTLNLEEPRSAPSPTHDLEEPRPALSPTTFIEEQRTSSSPTPDLEEPIFMFSPIPDLKEARFTASPTPDLVEPRSTASHTPDLVEPRSTASPTPDLVEPRSTASPTPDLVEPRSTASPTPDLVEPRSTASPTPDLVEPRSTASPTPDLVEPRSTASPTHDLVEPSSTASPTHDLVVEPRSTASPTHDLVVEPRSTASPIHDLVVELRSTASPTHDLVEPRSTASPTPDLVEPRSTASPNPDLVEPRSTASPTPDLAEPRSTASPTPDLAEPRSTASPIPDLAEPRSTASSAPDVAEPRSTASPSPDLVEPRSAASPTPDLVEPWSAASPTPELVEPRSAASPTPELVEPRSSTLPQPLTPSDLVFADAQIKLGVDSEFQQPSMLENFLQESGLEVHGAQERSPLEVQCIEDSAPMKSVLDPAAESVLEVEAMDTQGPISEVVLQVEPEPMEFALEHEPAHKVVCQVQEPALEVMHTSVPEVVSLIKDSHEIQEPMSELPLHDSEPFSTVVSSEPEVVLHLLENPSIECVVPGSVTHLSDSVPEIRDCKAVAKTVETVCNAVHESSKAGLDLFAAKMECVPEPLHKKIQHELSTVSVEEKVLALGVAEINQGVHPVTEQCTELGVEVKLFLQPVLKTLEEGPNKEDLSSGFHIVSHRTELKSEETSLHVVSKVKSVLEPGNVQMSSKVALVETETQADSAVTTQLKSLENELDSNCIHFDTEPSIEPNLKCTEKRSIAGDVDCDLLSRDANQELKSVDKMDTNPELDHQQVSRIASEAAQLNDCSEWCLEESKLSPIDPVMEACSDNRDQYKSPLAVPEQTVAVGGIADLSPGSEVQVTLDHIIQDALVVSFRHGDRIFSGVLMDLSKRFGPHGIPVTVHPQREYKNKPEEPTQVQSTSFQEDPKKELHNEDGTTDVSPVQSSEPCGVHNLWTSKPPPLFHEGAPYPPPLFIRDTYNQSIPQPPPRKIKRLKKKIYREEPTSIMNAIKLRPRQVLCDKCKNVVADKKEVRKTGTDSFKLEEGKRRRHESVTTVNKKTKTDHKVNGKSQNESQKRNSVSKVTSLSHGRGRVVRVASQTHTTKAQLHTKKVLQSKNMDHVKARVVLKMAKEKAQKKQKDASSSKNTHGKVHFTRRLQNTSSGTLPPRLRIKPQRYRNEENDSSLKIGLESLRSSKIGIKPQTRHTATRSAGEAPSNGPQEEASSDIQNTSVCVPPKEQDEEQTLSKGGSKSNITVYMTLNQKADSSSASVCSSDSTDDLKSTHSECSSTENFDFPPGSMHAPSSSSSSSSKEEKKLSNSLKIKVFSKNVSKCMSTDGRTICVGDIVWAKIYGFPWWPARILAITISRKDNGLLVRQEARISWFGSPTTSFLALSQLSPFLENFQSRFNKKRKGLYRKAITEAAKAAKQLTPEVRALLTQFET